MFSAFLAQQQRVQEELKRTAEEIQRRNDEVARKVREQMRLDQEKVMNDLKRMEQMSPKTIVLNPAPNRAAPPPPLKWFR